MWLTLAMMCGVFLYGAYPSIYLPCLLWGSFILSVSAYLIYGTRRRSSFISDILYLFLGFVLGASLSYVFTFKKRQLPPGEVVDVTLHIRSFGTLRPSGMRYYCHVLDCSDPILKGHNLAFYSGEDDLLPGSLIKLKVKLKGISSFFDQEEGKADLHGYGHWLLSKGMSGSVYALSDVVYLGSDDSSLKVKALLSNLSLRRSFSSLPLDAFSKESLLSMILGRGGMPSAHESDVSMSYRNCGASHILAVSGFHLGVVALLIYLLTYPLRLFCVRLPNLIILAAVWWFSWICGLSPSTIRAALMLSIYYISFLLPYPGDTLNILAVSAMILLFINPYMVYDYGFALSYVSVLSILVFMPLLRSFVSLENPLIDYLWSLFLVGVSVQPLVLPLCLYFFGSHALLGVIMNLPLAILSTLMIPLGVLRMLISFCSIRIPLLDQALCYLAEVNTSLLKYFTSSSLPQIEGQFPFLLVVILWLMFLGIATYCHIRLIEKQSSWLVPSRPQLS